MDHIMIKAMRQTQIYTSERQSQNYYAEDLNAHPSPGYVILR